MPRRSFVLLVLVVLAGSWTPPQQTMAQAVCPEGGCKVFLPVIHTPQYMRVMGWGWYTHFGRYVSCEDPTAYVALKNVGKEFVKGVNISVRGALNDGTDASFDGGRSDIIVFPGDTVSIEYPIDKPSDPSGEDCYGTFDADVSITDVTLSRNLHEVTVLSTEVTVVYACYGRTDYRITGEIRNDTAFTLSNLEVYFRSGADEVIGGGGSELDPLEPGAVAAYHGSLTTYEDNLGQCQPVFGSPIASVRAAGIHGP